ncbi:sulfurtransferase TusA family protein [Rhizorhapis suberifaciens]|uniref:sulfurtransferase TusA family protein n=1 Tax=Rhizorhapis suberifaciens TaxID=13656 RepID=UPI002ADE9053|nr:sulfurtransferase TusA family protein [Rhizorhapis suberifaciens]
MEFARNWALARCRCASRYAAPKILMENKPILVDARGMRCPWPALRAARTLRQSSEILILADDPAAPAELHGLARQNGWRCIEQPTSDGPGFLIRR